MWRERREVGNMESIGREPLSTSPSARASRCRDGAATRKSYDTIPCGVVSHCEKTRRSVAIVRRWIERRAIFSAKTLHWCCHNVWRTGKATTTAKARSGLCGRTYVGHRHSIYVRRSNAETQNTVKSNGSYLATISTSVMCLAQ